jgi:hypothetical protein
MAFRSAFKSFGKSFRFHSHEMLDTIYDNPIKILGLSVVYDFTKCYFIDQSFKDSTSLQYRRDTVDNKVDMTSTFDVIEGVPDKLCNLMSSYYYAMSSFHKNPLHSFGDRKIIFRSLNSTVDDIKFSLDAKNPVMIKVMDFSTRPELDDKFNIIRMKTPGSQCRLFITGYDDVEKRFTVLNSLGKEYGNNGVSYLPYDYVDIENKYSWLTRTLLRNKGSSMLASGLNKIRKVLSIGENELEIYNTYVLTYSNSDSILNKIFSFKSLTTQAFKALS